MGRKSIILGGIVLLIFSHIVYAELDFQEFLQRLEETYADIQDLQALVTSKEFVPSGRERTATKIEIKALPRKDILRVELLEPSEIRGQIYTINSTELSQYIPVNNVIVKTDIAKIGLPLEFLSFDLEAIIERLAAEGFSFRVWQEIEPPTREPITLDLDDSITAIISGLPTVLNLTGLSLSHCLSSQGALPLALRVSNLALGSYVLEAVPQEVQVVTRQLVWIDPSSLLPHRLETYSLGKYKGEVQELVRVTIIEDIKIDQGLTEEKLLTLPRDAEVIDTRD